MSSPLFTDEARRSTVSPLWTPLVAAAGKRDGGICAYDGGSDVLSIGPDGALRLRAVQATDGSWRSAWLSTDGKFSFTYGTASARIAIPRGLGLLPAFWLVGSPESGWPGVGEIDVMEAIQPFAQIQATIHSPLADGTGHAQAKVTAPFAGDFRTYSVTRAPGSISFAVDGKTIGGFTAASWYGKWVFDNQPMHLLLSLSVGGSWPGATTATTAADATMLVDWVRVTA